MSPPNSKDWWLAAALSSAALPAAMGQTNPATPNAGAVAGMVTAASTNATTAGQTVAIGNDVKPGQRFTTGAGGAMHLLFVDQSAVTLGPDSDLVIETFAYDPATQKGQIRLKLNQGLVRVVGGKISKTQPTVIATQHGRVEIQGGISVVEYRSQNTSATFLFGQQMRATDNIGNTQTITRQGFGTSLSGNGVAPPTRTNPSDLTPKIKKVVATLSLPTGWTTQDGLPPYKKNPNNPAPARAGQLISTGDSNSGVDSLSNDRLTNNSDNLNKFGNNNTLRNLLNQQTPNAS